MRASLTVLRNPDALRATDARAGGFGPGLPAELAAPRPAYAWMPGDWEVERRDETPKSPWFAEYDEME
jgi:hypothetical protein